MMKACVVALAVAIGCRSAGPPVRPSGYDPAQDLGPLFHDV